MVTASLLQTLDEPRPLFGSCGKVQMASVAPLGVAWVICRTTVLIVLDRTTV